MTEEERASGASVDHLNGRIGEVMADGPREALLDPQARRQLAKAQLRQADRDARLDFSARQAEQERQEREQRRQERQRRRRTNRAERTESWTYRRAVAAGWGRAALLVVPILFPVTMAWTGQIMFWWRTAGFTLPLAIAFAGALELTGMYLAYLTHQALINGDSTAKLRLSMWVFAALAGTMNYFHFAPTWRPNTTALAFGVMSLAAVYLWDCYSRHRHRQALRERHLLDGQMPRFRLMRWLRFPVATFRAWSVALALGGTMSPQEALRRSRIAAMVKARGRPAAATNDGRASDADEAAVSTSDRRQPGSAAAPDEFDHPASVVAGRSDSRRAAAGTWSAPVPRGGLRARVFELLDEEVSSHDARENPELAEWVADELEVRDKVKTIAKYVRDWRGEVDRSERIPNADRRLQLVPGRHA